ncbi:unnamed protein product [Ectocarpus sp. CCAP 1310/34]|nr:unnamed protein product [Ectocarpus sp. CCAP 1310/34]
MSTTTLAFPDYEAAIDGSRPFQLSSDASVHGFGAVLEQQQGDGTMRPLVYVSRSTLPNERNWDATDLEMGALVWAVMKLRVYLYGIPSWCVAVMLSRLPQLATDKDESGPNRLIEEGDLEVSRRTSGIWLSDLVNAASVPSGRRPSWKIREREEVPEPAAATAVPASGGASAARPARRAAARDPTPPSRTGPAEDTPIPSGAGRRHRRQRPPLSADPVVEQPAARGAGRHGRRPAAPTPTTAVMAPEEPSDRPPRPRRDSASTPEGPRDRPSRSRRAAAARRTAAQRPTFATGARVKRLVDSGHGCATGPTSSGPPRERETP